MSTTYTTIGDALFAFVSALSIAAATPDGEPTVVWGDKLNRPPKANELNVYPALLVMPAGDAQETADTDTDADAVTYSVFIVFSFAEASFAEDTLRQVADIVRTAFRELRADPSPLLAAAYDLTFNGEWGGTPDQGERYYKLNVTVYVHETLVTP
jgi:hypothetical protein